MVQDTLARVIANERLSPEYCVLHLEAPEIAAQVHPGQFVMIRASSSTDPLLRRPFSIFEIVRDQAGPTGISILNKRVGPVTSRLYDTDIGARLACLGPLGRAFSVVQPPAEAWMVAGGVGLAPFATLADALGAAGTPTRLFYGARLASDLYRIELFEQLGVEVVTTTEDGSRGERGLVTGALESALRQMPPDVSVTLYACGPTPMMKAVADLGRRHERSVEVSLEQIMGCGLGGCYSCVVGVWHGGAAHYVRSCLEGPVFRAASLDWSAIDRH